MRDFSFLEMLSSSVGNIHGHEVIAHAGFSNLHPRGGNRFFSFGLKATSKQ